MRFTLIYGDSNLIVLKSNKAHSFGLENSLNFLVKNSNTLDYFFDPSLHQRYFVNLSLIIEVCP